MKQNCVAIILARGGSKGLPGKNTMDFCGKPLFAWSILQAKNTPMISEVFVTSDDDHILDIAQQYGAVCIKRPDEYATDTVGLEPAIKHALGKIRNRQKRDIDIVVCLQSTSPIRRENDINDAINQFIGEEVDSLFSANVLEDCCIWQPDGDIWKSITYDYKNRGRRQDRDPFYWENGSIYVFTPEILYKNDNRVGGMISVYLMPYWTSFEIDSLNDVEICSYYFEKKLLRRDLKKQ
tara:strand:- start:270 stop:980 length:711 start_codon:yes stop_codon:yes gene_type:complete